MPVKRYIVVNLNQGESRETRLERWKERFRWMVFAVLVLILLGLNAGIGYVSYSYDRLIEQKQQEIERIRKEIEALRARGKNLSKNDIISLAKLEENRIIWARKLELLGKMTPDDMALTGLRYKHGKLQIDGIAVVYDDQKDFDIVNNYVNTLRYNQEFSREFTRIKFTKFSRHTIRGQEIIQFQIEAALRGAGSRQPSSRTTTS
jgi:Tfp pilus assembly protein PilN